MRSDRELDQLIDAALPGYSQAEPRSGFEERVLARSLAERPRQRLNWRWAFALPAVACLVVMLFVAVQHNPSRQRIDRAGNVPAGTKPVITKRVITGPTPVAAEPASSISARRASESHTPRAIKAAAREPLPKRDVFPTPTPPTAEERALIEALRPPVQHLRPQTDAEVEIAPIRIADLEVKPLASSAEDSSQAMPRDQQP